MRKEIIGNIIEIIIAILLVFISIPFWNDLEANKKVLDNTLASSGLELSAEKYDDDVLATTGNLNHKTYYITNNSNINSSGKLLFKYSKRSLVNYKYLNITVNDYTTSLSNIYSSEDDNYYIFLLNTFNLNGGERKNYNITLDVMNDYIMECQGKSYVYNIEINTDRNI